MLCKKMKIMKWSTVIRTLVRIFIVVTLKNLFIDKSNLYLKTSVAIYPINVLIIGVNEVLALSHAF